MNKLDLMQHLIDNNVDERIIGTVMNFILVIEEDHEKEIRKWIQNTRSLLEKMK